MDEIKAKYLAELWLIDQPARRRLLIFRIVMLLGALASMSIAIGMAAAGKPDVSRWIILPYSLPCIGAFFLSFRYFSETVPFVAFFYLVTANTVTHLVSEPAYLTDIITFSAFVAGCYAIFRPTLALGISLYHFVGLITTGLIVKYHQPFPIIYRNTDAMDAFIVVGFSCGFFIWILSHIQSRNSDRYLEQLREQVLEILQLNQDQNLLLGVVLHDFSNDLMRAMMLTERIESGRADSDVKKRLDLALGAMADLVGQLKRLRHGGSLAVKSGQESVRIGEIFERAQLGFRELLKVNQVQLLISGDVDATVEVPLIILSASIVNNLISNAIKFSSSGQFVKVSIRDAKASVAVSILNMGPKTDPQAFRAAFDGTLSRMGIDHSERGQGLGLRIAVRFCQRLGIQISGRQEDSADQVATTVELVIPKGK